jgi:hypothetical protein
MARLTRLSSRTKLLKGVERFHGCGRDDSARRGADIGGIGYEEGSPSPSGWLGRHAGGAASCWDDVITERMLERPIERD